jgi:hypothetical protein
VQICVITGCYENAMVLFTNMCMARVVIVKIKKITDYDECKNNRVTDCALKDTLYSIAVIVLSKEIEAHFFYFFLEILLIVTYNCLFG